MVGYCHETLLIFLQSFRGLKLHFKMKHTGNLLGSATILVVFSLDRCILVVYQ